MGNFFSRLTTGVVLAAFLNMTLGPVVGLAQGIPVVSRSLPFRPLNSSVQIRGIKIYPQDPLRFNFFVDRGRFGLKDQSLMIESKRLIKYFLAALTTPEEQMWVNLSPSEKERIIPDAFGRTGMGRDLLTQDYLLKQLTASLLSPDNEFGRGFWERVYANIQQEFGTREIPTDVLNKVWIVPEKAVVYEHEASAFVVDRRLRVMMDQDKIKNQGLKNIMLEIVIPQIEKAVNEQESFSVLRQIYDCMILATWYKKRLKESMLSQVYVNQNKITGIDLKDKYVKEKIFKRYLKVFQQGVSHLVKEEYDPITQEVFSRKYFTGGFTARPQDGPGLEGRIQIANNPSELPLDGKNSLAAIKHSSESAMLVDISARLSKARDFQGNKTSDPAMSVEEIKSTLRKHIRILTALLNPKQLQELIQKIIQDKRCPDNFDTIQKNGGWENWLTFDLKGENFVFRFGQGARFGGTRLYSVDAAKAGYRLLTDKRFGVGKKRARRFYKVFENRIKANTSEQFNVRFKVNGRELFIAASGALLALYQLEKLLTNKNPS